MSVNPLSAAPAVNRGVSKLISGFSGLPGWMRSVPFISLHVACLAVFFTGVDMLALALCAITYFVRMFGITAGFHRYFSHRSFKTGRVFQFILGWLGTSSMQKGPLWWAAHHRDHHRFSDQEGDPHSPVISTIWWAHIGWVLSPKFDGTDMHAVKDIARFPEIRWLNTFNWVPGLVMAVACYLIGGWTGLVWGFFISTILVYHATFTVNSLCHLVGRRRYRTKDDSRNNWFVAVITLGEGWHNNHHYYQSSANQGFFWWELDVSYYILKFFQSLGVVWDMRKPSPERIKDVIRTPALEPALAQPILATSAPASGTHSG